MELMIESAHICTTARAFKREVAGRVGPLEIDSPFQELSPNEPMMLSNSSLACSTVVASIWELDRSSVTQMRVKTGEVVPTRPIHSALISNIKLRTDAARAVVNRQNQTVTVNRGGEMNNNGGCDPTSKTLGYMVIIQAWR